MRTWRTWWWIGLVGVVVALLVVPVSVSAQVTASATPRLLVQSPTGVSVFDPQGGRTALWATDARASGDWSALVSSVPSGGGARVRTVDAGSGSLRHQFDVPDRASVRVVSFRGDLAALSPDPPGNGAAPPGRARTTLLVAATDGSDTDRYELAGNIEPEAFSSDGRALFVIEYLPPMQPDRYQVRRLDLATGTMGEVASPDGAAQGQMPGVARTQVMSPDGSRLYTLYTSAHAGGHAYSFVHVLDLDAQWAHCVDLPRPFGDAPESMGITISPDGRQVFVADVASGRLAKMPTDRLAVDQVGRLSVRGHRSAPHLAASSSLVYVGSGRTLLAVRQPSLVLSYHESLPKPVRGVVLPAASPLLYVAHGRELAALDPTNGTIMSSAATEIPRRAQLGSTTVLVPGDTVKCAC